MIYGRRRLGARPKASFGDIFTQYIAPTVSTAGTILDQNLKVSGFAGKSDDDKAAYGKVIKPQGQRDKAWIGMAVGAATNIASGIFGAAAKKRAEARQREQQFRQAQLKTMQNNANSFNKQMDYLRHNRNAGPDLEYRLGGTPNRTRLGARNFVITDGGDARQIGHNTFLLRGGSHEDVNETGQTGIGIDVGGNQIEAEGGEVAQKKGNTLRIFSAQPILKNGVSPAEAVEAGASKDKVFNAQQDFKRRNHLKDDGTKAKYGKVGHVKPNYYRWMHQTSDNLRVSPIDSSYDYRAYYDSASPWELYNTMYNKDNGHFTDVGKRPNHPTFSNESKYSNSKASGGTWNGDVFVPSMWQFGNNGNARRYHYMMNSGEGYFDGKRNVYPRKKDRDGDLVRSYFSGNDSSYIRPKSRPQWNQARVMKSKYSTTNDGRNNPSERFRQDYPYIARPVSKIPIMPWQKKSCGGRIKAGLGREERVYYPEQHDWIETLTRNNPRARKVLEEIFGSRSDRRRFVSDLQSLGVSGDEAVSNVSPAGIPGMAVRSMGKIKQVLRRAKTPLANTINGGKQLGKQAINRIRNVWDNTISDKYDKIVYGLAAAEALTLGPIVYNLSRGDDEMSNDESKADKSVKVTKSNKPSKAANKQDKNIVVNDSNVVKTNVNKDDTARVDTSSNVLPEVVITAKRKQTPTQTNQYKGNVTKGNYQLHDGESKVINGIKYTRIGNNIVNHKTKVSYVYDTNGNYTGKADYSKVGKNFNDAFDAARAAGRKDFIYRAGKYNNYTTMKETNANKEALNRKVGATRIAKAFGGNTRHQAGDGTWVKPSYNTANYNGSKSIRKTIARYEGTDFAKQNAQFHGDAIGAKEKELRRFMGAAYNSLNDNQRDALLSYYYNVKPSTFTSRYGALRDRLIRASNEVEFNDTLNAMKTNINTGMNNEKLKGLRKRRLYEQGLFGGTGVTTTVSSAGRTSTKTQSHTVAAAPVTQSQTVVIPASQTPVVKAPVAANYQGYGGFVPDEERLFTPPTGRLYDYIVKQGNNRQPQRFGGSSRKRCSGGTVSRPVKENVDRITVTPDWKGIPHPLPDTWDVTDMFKTKHNMQPSNTQGKYPYDRTATAKVDDDFNAWTQQRVDVPNDNNYWQQMAVNTAHTPDEMKANNQTLRSDGKVGYNYLTPLRLPAKERNIWQEANDDIQKGADKWQSQTKVSGPVTTQSVDTNDNTTQLNGDFGNDNWEMRPTTGDWIGLGIDTLSALGTGLINNLYLNKANYDYVTPEWVAVSDAILDTKYRNAAQRAAVERTRLNNVKSIMRNTASSAVAQQRTQRVNTDAMYENNKLWDDKMNKELELRNRQAELNANIHTHNAESRNNWFNTVAAIKNQAIQDKNANDLAKAQSLNATLSGLSQAYNNFYTSARQRYEDDIAMRMYMAGSQYATPSRMLAFGVPMSDGQLVGIMNDINGMKDPGPKPDKKDYQNATEYSKALTKWEEDNRAYQHKQEYYNLAKRRLSKKGRKRLGIS